MKHPERFHKGATIRALRQLGYSDADIADELTRAQRYGTQTVVIVSPTAPCLSYPDRSSAKQEK